MKAVKPRRHGGGREEEGEDFFVHEKRERKSGQGQESNLAVYSLPVIKDIGIPVFSVCAFHAHPLFPDFPRASVATPLLRPSSVLSWPPLFSGLPPCLRGYPSFSGSAPCLRGHPSSPAFLRASVVTHLPRLSSAPPWLPIFPGFPPRSQSPPRLTHSPLTRSDQGMSYDARISRNAPPSRPDRTDS
jgi:hypothetical protein